ncbi:transposase [Actinomadura sp. NAK00032]|uniref:transposase n=1 Tax=Actinomadura sp. NAK00032 TaxID=2742128 RepID=UPI001C3795EB|nr:transposase [Actinomadura sp. NAK00032]
MAQRNDGKSDTRWLARRCKILNEELADVDAEIEALVRRCAPALLELAGVGPGVAATLLVAAGDNPHRLRSEVDFAHMAGAAPLPTGSAASPAAVTVSISRRQQRPLDDRPGPVRMDQRTKDHLARRTAQGKTKKEIIRCLKRYVAREIYQVLARATAIAAPVAR